MKPDDEIRALVERASQLSDDYETEEEKTYFHIGFALGKYTRGNVKIKQGKNGRAKVETSQEFDFMDALLDILKDLK